MLKQVPLDEVTRNPGLSRGNGERAKYDETFTLLAEIDGSVAALSHVLDELPEGAVVEQAYIRNKTASVIATGTAVALGITGELDRYGELTHAGNLAAEGAEWHFTADANDPLPAASNLLFSSTNGSGSGAGTVNGTWYVKVTGKISSKIAMA